MLYDSDEPRRKIPRFKERISYEDNEKDFQERYRFTPRLVNLLLDELGDSLEPTTNRSHALSSKEKLLAALCYYASGHFYYSIADTQG